MNYYKNQKKNFIIIVLCFITLFISGCKWFDGDDDSLSDINNLTSLTVSEGTLAPGFSPAVTTYSIDVDNTVESIQVTATVEDSAASIEINGIATASGAAIALSVGANTISVTVTAENDDSITYTITVTRAEPVVLSNDADLSGINISAGDLVPAFTTATLTYNVSVGNVVDSMTVTPTAADTNATIMVNAVAVISGSASNAIALAVGNTDISLEVTAEDGVTTNTYTITVSRDAPPASDADLSGISLSTGDLVPTFATATLTYNVSVLNAVDSMTVTPTAADANATITINTVAVTSGSPSGDITLAVGDTDISIVVTAEDGVTTSNYTITVSREAPVTNDANLSGISLSTGALSPAFAASTLSYTSSVAYTTTSITVTPSLSDNNATVTVNNVAVTSGVASGSIDLAEGDNTITLIVLAEDAVSTQTYTITVTRQGASGFAQAAYIKASNTDAVDWFGRSITFDGDTLVVGAPREESNAQGIDGDQSINGSHTAGAVYVFTRDVDNNWTQQAYIKGSNTEQGDLFGKDVALEQDTLVVGANGEDSVFAGINVDQSDNSLSAAGAVYVFTRTGEIWTQQAYLKASNPGVNDNYGSRVEISGDTIAVGTQFEDSNARGINGDDSNDDSEWSGAVYVYVRNNDIWSQQAYIKASNTGVQDRFGQDIALQGDTLAVGAYQEGSDATGINGSQNNNSGFGSGAVYMFTRSGTTWSQDAYIKASNTETGSTNQDFFGFSVALSGNTLAVGAKQENSAATGIDGNQSDNSATKSGAVYIFTNTSGIWSQQAYIKPSNTSAIDWFGHSLSLSGDNLVVGAPLEDSNDTGVDGNQNDNSMLDAGAVYYFLRTNGVWSQQAYIKASNTDSGDWFGETTLVSGNNLFIGSYSEDSNATGIGGNEGDNSAADAGAVYAFKLPSTATGTLDTSFGTAGMVDVSGESITTDSSGNVYVAGVGDNSNPAFTRASMYLRKFDSNGTPDSTFGGGDGLVIYDNPIGADGAAFGTGIALDNAGNIFVTGFNGSYASGTTFTMMIWKYLPNGTLDTSFGSNGMVSNINARAASIVLDSSNNIYVTGVSLGANSTDMAIWKYQSDGTADITFGTSGFVDHTIYGLGQDVGNSISLDSSGNIYIAGYSLGANSTDMAIWKYDSTGTLDTSFNTDGYVVHNDAAGGNGVDQGNGMTLDGSGNIYVTGSSSLSNYEMVIWKYDNTGQLDTSFDTDGIFVNGNAGGGNGHDLGYGITLDDSGNIFVTGYSRATNNDLAIWKLKSDGTLDSTFGTAGIVINDSGTGGNSGDMGLDIMLDNSGNIYVVGSALWKYQ
ncbi:MAG: hypothetical protein GY781_02785 [Gammaproteobacteria bacterium]|nr:hypothetical protein [Gammaproteobacteria bacterium]